jgi:LuxR family maltose regulon positive regulatory protein
MLGDEAEAVRLFREGAASTLHRPIIESGCLAHLAIIDVEHGRWESATTQARRARAMLGETPAPPSVLVLAASVLVETHAGRADEVELDRQRCRQHLTALVDVAPWLNVQARFALARAAVLRGNRVEAGALAEEVEAILANLPGAVRVTEQLQSLRRELATRDRTHGFGPSSLTTAELRVLQLLPTHLSVAEIAERLYVSRNTVKSQTISIYRKLGTSSRGGAVERAIATGLLEGAPGKP